MKIKIYSDLHLEFEGFEPPQTEADLVILAGDIHTKSRGVAWANETFSVPVIYVCGNHEYYGGHIDRTLRKMKDAAASHVHVLENQAFLWQQTRFLCATAWTDFSATGDVVAAVNTAWSMMNDFQVIRAEASYRRLRPQDVIDRNKATFLWLKEQISTPFQGLTVVVTHHAPMSEVAGQKYEGHISAAYANRWQALLEGVDVWIFGHTHHAVDTELNGCRLISNPRGYPAEDVGFAPGFMIDI